MKKILFLSIAFWLIALSARAQQYSISPQSFTAEDNITITVNFTGTPLANYAGDIYIWSWVSLGCPSNCDAPTNVNPANPDSQADAKLTRDAVNPNLYTISFRPTTFYNRVPAQIQRIGFIFKGADWSNGQTSPDILVNVEPLVFTPKVNRIFPTKVTKDDVVTLYLDQAAAANLDLKYQTGNFTIDVTAYNAEGEEVGTSIEGRVLTNAGNGLHYFRILPTYTFDSSEVASVKYRFHSVANAEVESEEFELIFFN